MGNHYHLMLQIPLGNIGRIMWHINGVYTQRYNRLKHTDRPLFKGCYKAILIEEDVYLLALSRYIHRNPIETKRPLVKKLEQFSWSSHTAYINNIEYKNLTQIVKGPDKGLLARKVAMYMYQQLGV